MIHLTKLSLCNKCPVLGAVIVTMSRTFPMHFLVTITLDQVDLGVSSKILWLLTIHQDLRVTSIVKHMTDNMHKQCRNSI